MSQELAQSCLEIEATHNEILQSKVSQITVLEAQSARLEEEHLAYQQNNEKLIASKDKQIERWKKKYAQNDAENREFEEKYTKMYNERQRAMNNLSEVQQTLDHTHSNLECAERELGIAQNEKNVLDNEL